MRGGPRIDSGETGLRRRCYRDSLGPPDFLPPHYPVKAEVGRDLVEEMMGAAGISTRLIPRSLLGGAHVRRSCARSR